MVGPDLNMAHFKCQYIYIYIFNWLYKVPFDSKSLFDIRSFNNAMFWWQLIISANFVPCQRISYMQLYFLPCICQLLFKIQGGGGEVPLVKHNNSKRILFPQQLDRNDLERMPALNRWLSVSRREEHWPVSPQELTLLCPPHFHFQRFLISPSR